MNNYNDETNSTPWDAPLEKKNTELFISPFFQDWTIILALAAVVYSSWTSASTYGGWKYFQAGDWLAITIDMGVAAGIQGLIFGIVPAALRLWRLKRSKIKVDCNVTLKTRWFWLLIISAAFLTGLITIFTSTIDGQVGITQQRCEQRGLDEVCIEATYLGESRATIVTSWNYAEPKIIDGQLVQVISYGLVIDCNLRRGYVNSFETFDSSGQKVNISQTNRQQMIDGFEQQKLSEIPDSACGAD